MSNILVSEINGLKVYNLSSGRSLQEMLKNAKYNIKKLKKDEEYMNKIELIQDFEYPVSSTCIKITEDGSHLFTAGLYAPRLKIYDLNEMTLKVERGVDAEVRKIACISNDYTKCALLLDDRNIEIHAQYGKHFTVRIPKFGRDMIYNKSSCDLFSCGTGNEVYRLNLCEGSFLKSFETEIDGINSCRNNSFLDVLGVCGNGGKVEIWDLKSHERISSLPILENSFFNNYDTTEMTSLEFNKYYLALGNKQGKTSVYDLRYPTPLYTIKHSYRFPINTIKFHESSGNIITVDKKMAKFSNSKNGNVFTNIEANNDINDFESFEGSGMFFTANESPKMDIFYVPGIGPAPKWCSFLEKITEELEDNKTFNISEDHKFLVMKDLEELSCTNLIGTKFLKSYMHGYFMEMKLYKKLRSIAEPLNYQKYLEDKKQEKINKILESRIVVNKNQRVKVNKEMLEDNSKAEVAQDSRFKDKLFTNQDFAIDSSSLAFKKNKDKVKKGAAEETKGIKNIGELNEEQAEGEKPSSKKIVNPDILKLNEKLIKKKKQRFDHLNDEDQDEVDFNERINSYVHEDLTAIQDQIKKAKIKQNRLIDKQSKKKTFDKSRLEGRRLLNNKRK